MEGINVKPRKINENYRITDKTTKKKKVEGVEKKTEKANMRMGWRKKKR